VNTVLLWKLLQMRIHSILLGNIGFRKVALGKLAFWENNFWEKEFGTLACG